MYYNKFLGRFVVDAFDYYLLSTLIVSYGVSYLKNYFSEEAKMQRLRQDLISKSGLIEFSKPRKPLNSKTAKTQRIYKFARDTRGGSDQKIPFELAKKIEGFFIKLAYFLRKNERYK